MDSTIGEVSNKQCVAVNRHVPCSQLTSKKINASAGLAMP